MIPSMSKFFQGQQKLHKPVWLEQFVVFEKNLQVLSHSKLHEINHVINREI